jgi:hypothetical protein
MFTFYSEFMKPLEKDLQEQKTVGSMLTLIRMTKDEKGLAFFKGLLL